MSRIITTLAAIAATTLMSSAAFAGCNTGPYCNSTGQSSSLPSLSSWSGSSHSTSSYQNTPSYSHASTSRYSTSPMASSSYSYGASNGYAGTLSSSYADSAYGTGSISNAYTGSDVELYGFSGAASSVPGLGAGESLQATSCPVSVHNPSGARVLGCYNVVKPVPQTTYYRVVRPIVYVRYPVPVAVPYWSGCTVVTHTSRYGDRVGHGGNYGGRYGRRCG